MENKREILNGIRHYWFKGNIRDKQLFAFIDVFFSNEDPFQKEEYIKAIAKNVIINHCLLETNLDKNTWINGFTINKEIFDRIFTEEFHRLKDLIGKKEVRKRCNNCGVKNDKEIVLFDGKEFEFEQSTNVMNLSGERNLRKGNLYWKWNCSDCGWVYDDIELEYIQG